MREVWSALATVLGLVTDVVTRGPAVVGDATSGDLLWPGVGVALLAAASALVGQSSVLFVNRVRGVRLVVASLVGTVWTVVLLGVEGVVTWAVATFLLAGEVPVRTVVTLFLLAQAPSVFGALSFLPHVGMTLARLLSGWSFLVLALMIAHVYGAPFWLSVGVAGSGWLTIQILSRALAVPLGWVGSRVWTLVSGRSVWLTSRDVLAGTPFVPVTALPASGPDDTAVRC